MPETCAGEPRRNTPEHGAAGRRRSLTMLARFGVWALYRSTVDRAAARGPARPVPGRIALFRLDGIGDFTVGLDAAAALRRRYPAPAHRVVLIAERSFAALAERLPYFDEVWPVDYRKFVLRPGYRYGVLRRVHAGGFEAAVNLMHTRGGIAGRGGLLGGDALVRASGANDRVGSADESAQPSCFHRRASDSIYTRLIPVPPAGASEFRRNAALVRGLGAEDRAQTSLALPVSERDVQGLMDEGTGDYAVLIPGALAEHRRWPVARFIEIARRIHERTGWAIVACGGRSEAHLGAALEQNRLVPIRNLVGRTAIPNLAALIAGARLVVANETGAAHLAAAVRTPSLCLLGGGHHGRFVPYPEEVADRLSPPLPVVHPMACFGCDWRCVYAIPEGMPAPCIERISVDAAWDALEPLIESLIPDGTLVSGKVNQAVSI